MSSGSWLGHGEAANEGIGTTPGLMGPEEKLFLGWLDHSTVDLGQSGDYTLNPSQFQARGKDQAVRVNLPAKHTDTPYTRRQAPPGGPATDGLNGLTCSVDAGTRVTVTPTPGTTSRPATTTWRVLDRRRQNWQRAGNPVDGSSNGRRTRRGTPTTRRTSMFRSATRPTVVHLPGAFIDTSASTVSSTTSGRSGA
jgi:immune inhibitor A